jgi:hypothetical protein
MSQCVEDGPFSLVILLIMIRNFKIVVANVNIPIVNSIGCLTVDLQYYIFMST